MYELEKLLTDALRLYLPLLHALTRPTACTYYGSEKTDRKVGRLDLAYTCECLKLCRTTRIFWVENVT